MSGWGLTPWGLGPWGFGFGPLFIDSAYAVADRVVRFTLSAPPLEARSTVAGSVYNPATWTVQVPSTARVLTVLSIAKVDTLTYELLTLEAFDSHFVTMAVGSSTLRDATGSLVGLITFGYAGALREATSTNERRATTRGFGLRDIANPQAPTSTSPGGTLEITSGGDYKSVEGSAMLRKLIFRRLLSMRGDFFHLPQYGAGLREKEPLPDNDLIKLKKAIELQVLQEQDVAAVNVRLAYDYGTAALLVGLQVRMKQTGQQVDVQLPIPTGAIQF